jgi:colanic acid/amylovoran biosynthesis glycosyltransferase
LRVAYLLERFPSLSETFIVTAIQGLLRAGHHVSVVSQHRPRPEEPLHEEVLGSRLLDETSYVEAPMSADSLEPIRSLPLGPGRHDVLHAHFGPNARRFMFARAQAEAPLVVTFHGYDFSSEPARQGASMYARLFEVADAVTVNCGHAGNRLESLGCPPDKLRTLRLPVDVATLPFRERARVTGDTLRFLTVGRLVEKKGHEIALRAIAHARRSLPDFYYDIVGDGPLAGRLASLVGELGLGDVVCLHGARDSTYVRRLLASAHVFVLASTTAADGDQEGTPVVLMEAQACGLPVVSTLHSGIPEVVIDGGSGLLVPEGDERALAEAVLRIVREHESWPRLGAAGRAHVAATFDVVPCTDGALDVYASAVAAYAGSVPSLGRAR